MRGAGFDRLNERAMYREMALHGVVMRASEGIARKAASADSMTANLSGRSARRRTASASSVARDFIRTEASPVLAVASTLLTLMSVLFFGI